MSRLEVITKTKAQSVVDDLYKDLERRIVAAPPGLCPVDMTASFLKLFHTQTCGKCVPCRIGSAFSWKCWKMFWTERPPWKPLI